MSRCLLAIALLLGSTIPIAPAAQDHAPPPDSIGVVRGDTEAADGFIMLKEPVSRRTFVADAAPVLMETTPDDTLAISFPMAEVAHVGDPPGPAEFVCQIEVPLAALPPANGLVAAPIRMTLSDRTNVFAVWLTVGFFEVTEEAPAHRFFAVIDRSR
jgi:hypothetical protein